MIKNFNLSETEFNEMLLQLKKGDRSLFEKVFLSNFEDCVQFLIRKYSIQRADAYDASMDALLMMYNKLIADKLYYGNLRFVFQQMASQVYLKKIQKQKHLAYQGEISEELPTALDSKDNAQYLVFLEKGLSKLGDSCRKLIHAFFYEEVSLKNYAEMQGKKPEAIRKQKQRCMKQLQTLMREVSNK